MLPIITSSSPTPTTATPGAPLHEIERLTDASRQSGGNLAAAARLLGMSRSGLRHRLHTYGLIRPYRHQAFPVAFGLPQTLEQLPQRAVQAALTQVDGG